ncbi:hypothetical protein HDU88_003434 [Geranomyces variabilis]|nr:hypothetical protein HDU88_003434 [Geranomyces variabilis]
MRAAITRSPSTRGSHWALQSFSFSSSRHGSVRILEQGSTLKLEASTRASIRSTSHCVGAAGSSSDVPDCRYCCASSTKRATDTNFQRAVNTSAPFIIDQSPPNMLRVNLQNEAMNDTTWLNNTQKRVVLDRLVLDPLQPWHHDLLWERWKLCYRLRQPVVYLVRALYLGSWSPGTTGIMTFQRNCNTILFSVTTLLPVTTSTGAVTSISRLLSLEISLSLQAQPWLVWLARISGDVNGVGTSDLVLQGTSYIGSCGPTGLLYSYTIVWHLNSVGKAISEQVLATPSGSRLELGTLIYQ